MNKQRRNDLQGVIDSLESAKQDLIAVRDEEQDAFDNLPDSLQYSSKGDVLQDNVSAMDDIESAIDDVISQIEELCQ